MTAEALQAASAYRNAGLSVIPIRPDGSKVPAVKWEAFQERLASEGELQEWFGNGKGYGVGVVGGKVSGNAEHLDFDHDAATIYPAWCAMVQAEVPALLDRLSHRRTPKGGFHVSYRCPEVAIPGNSKLAERLDPSDPKKRKRLALVETRGEGGQVLAPGCPPACHSTGRTYEHHRGVKLSQIQSITAAERAILIRCAASFNEIADVDDPPIARTLANGLRPGDDYNARGPSWQEILEPKGWRFLTSTWVQRPGKDEPGHSATVDVCRNREGHSLLAVFSSNAHPFEGPRNGKNCSCYSKFAAYAQLYHERDFQAAARELGRQGYGEQKGKPAEGNRGYELIDGGKLSETANGMAPEHEPALPGKVDRLSSDGETGPNEADNDPHRLARISLWGWEADSCRKVKPPALRLRYWQGEFYEYDGRLYRRFPIEEIRSRVNASTKAEFDRLNIQALEHFEVHGKDGEGKKEKDKPPQALKVTTKLTADVIQALSGHCLLPATLQPPAWIGSKPGPFQSQEILAAKNTLIHLPSFIAGKPATCAHSLDFFSFNALDYDFHADAGMPPHWLAFLSQVWANDPEAIAALQEWFGYCLLPDTRQQKILLIVGPKRSGKGTIARVLRALIGVDNTAGPTLAGLGTNFGLWPLLGKTLAIISDARLSKRTDAAAVTERLLSISGEDAVTIDRKNMSHVTSKLAVRFVILTNELPNLNDPSGALVSRMIVLRMTQSFYGKEDTGLTSRLLAELPAILLWAIEGLKRLCQRGHFVQPGASRRLIDDLEDLSSPVGAFIRERCLVGPEHEVFVRDLFQAWQSWSQSKGQKDSGTEQTFGRDLRAALPNLDVRQQRSMGFVVRKYSGIRLRDDVGEQGESP